MTGSSGGSTTTTKSGPPPQVLQAYQNLTSAATNQATQPLLQYGGPMVAGFTPQQQQGFSEIGSLQGVGVPYLNAAAQEFGTATTPLWPTLPQYSSDTVNQYLNPYTQDVTSALTNLYNQQNATQASTIAGNAAMHGAYGGDREAVAQALAAEAENLSQAPTLAQVMQQGFQGAQGEFNTQQQQQLAAEQANAWLASQAGFGLAGLGNQALTQGLTGANALLGAGGMQQQLAQEQMNIPYQQFLQQQAYPYQQLSFLAPIVEGTGSLSGGTGSTTTPGPSALSQIAGLGTAGLGLYGLGSNMGWWGTPDFSATGSDFGGGGELGIPPTKRGGSVRPAYAFGGAMPMVPGIGPGVPQIDLSYIPTAAPGGIPSSSGLSPFQPEVSQTQSGGGGSGILGALGPIATLAKIGASFFAEGGRASDEGGIIGDASTNRLRLPSVPAVNLDYIAHPGPAVKGSGPPHPPSVPQPPDQGLDAGKLLGDMKGLKDLGAFGSSDSEHMQAGGVPVSVAAQFGGEPPNVSGILQQLMELPLSRLEQMAVQYPPTSQQGQMVAQALARKKATLGAGTAPAASAPPSAATASSFAPQQEAPAPQQYGGTSHAMAAGGSTGFVTEDELDPYPIVDHTGDTVKIRYPSEGGKVLDLGIPTLKRSGYAAGGAASAFPQLSFANGEWAVSNPAGTGTPHTPIVGPANNAPLLGTGNAESVPGTATSHLASLPTANGVAVPQLSSWAFAPHYAAPGEGLPGWFAPLNQYQPPGTHVGPGGTLVIPGPTAYEPQMGGIISGLTGGSIPIWAGGSPAPPPSAPVASDIMSPTTPTFDPTMIDRGNIGDKRGGRIGFAEGGALEPASDQSALANLGRIIGEGDYPNGGAWNASEEMRRELRAKVHPGFAEGGEPAAPITPPLPGDSLTDKLKRIEDLHRENTEDPFPSFQRIIGVPTSRPGGGGFADGGSTFDYREYIEPPPRSDDPARQELERPQDKQRQDRQPSAHGSPKFADGGDTDDIGIGPAAIPPPDLTPTGFPADEPLSTKLGRMWRGDWHAGPFTAAPPDRLADERAESAPVFTATPPDRLADQRAGIATPPSGIGAGTGEPAAPEAMATPERAPPPTAPAFPSSPKEFTPNSRLEKGVPAGLDDALTRSNKALGEQPPEAAPALGEPQPTGMPARVGLSGYGPNAQMIDLDTGKPYQSPSGAPPAAAPEAPRPPYIAPGAPETISTGGQTNVKTVLDTAKAAGLAPGATAALIANGLGEGGFNDPWQKAWGTENSFGHWQYNQGGELPGYLAWLKESRLPNDSRSQALYAIKRMEEIHPGWSQMEDAQAATDLMATQFEKYKGAAPGQRYGLIPVAQKIMAGDFSVPLGPAFRRSGSTGGDQLVGPGTGKPGLTPASATADQAGAIAQHALANTPPEHRSAMREWMNSPYFLAFLAGAGMLASRSPFPGVAIGEGLKLAGSGAMTLGEQEARQADRQRQIDLEAARLAQTGQYQQGELDVRRQAADRQLAAENRRYETEMARLKSADARTAEIERHNQATEAITAGFRAAQIAKPLPSYQTDANGNPIYGTQRYNPLTERYEFEPGATVGKPVRNTLEERMVTSGRATDVVEARRMLADAARDPSGFKNSASYLHAVQVEKARLTRAGSTMGEAQLDAMARHNVDTDIAKFRAEQSTTPAAAPRAPTAPALTAPAAPAAPPIPTWAMPNSPIAHDAKGVPVYKGKDGGWHYADQRPYQP